MATDTDLYAEHYTEVDRIERMRRVRRLREYNLLGVSILLIFASVMVLMYVVRKVSSEAPFCDDAAYAYNSPNTMLLAWAGYPDGWEGVEPDLFVTKTPLVLHSEGMDKGYHLYSQSDGSIIIVVFNSYDVSSGVDGMNSGAHDTCFVLKWVPD
jgi:hypothetical protein